MTQKPLSSAQNLAQNLLELEDILADTYADMGEVVAAISKVYEKIRPKEGILETLVKSEPVHATAILHFFYGENNIQLKNGFIAKLLFLAQQQGMTPFSDHLSNQIFHLSNNEIQMDKVRIFEELQRLFYRHKNSPKTPFEADVWLRIATKRLGASGKTGFSPSTTDAARTCANTIQQELKTKPSSPFGASTRTL
jgi:hypothetical protein